jgi:hypothetical protein
MLEQRGSTLEALTKRLVKIDDPKHLTDSKEPKYEH